MAESNEKNRIKLKKICEKSIRFTKTAVDAFESIRDTAVDDDENFLDAKIYNKKMVDSLRSTIDSLTDGLLWVTENLDQIDPIDERSSGKFNTSSAASSSKKSKESSFSTKNNESEVKSSRKSLKTRTNERENRAKIPEAEKSRPESPAAKQKKSSFETSTSKGGKATKTSAKLKTLMPDPESSTPAAESLTANGDSVTKNVDDERQNLLNALGIDSDEEEIMQVDIGNEHEMNSSKFKDTTTEELSDVETKKISNRSPKMTTSNDSKQKNEPYSSKIDPKSNIIPESDLSSTDGDDEENADDSSEKKNCSKRRNGAVVRNLKKKHEKTKKDDENGIDFEKTLKNVKNFRLDKLIHSKKSSKANEPSAKKIKTNQANGETSSPTIENSDESEIESKENKISVRFSLFRTFFQNVRENFTICLRLRENC